jgi:hypothetical protein
MTDYDLAKVSHHHHCVNEIYICLCLPKSTIWSFPFRYARPVRAKHKIVSRDDYRVFEDQELFDELETLEEFLWGSERNCVSRFNAQFQTTHQLSKKQ